MDVLQAEADRLRVAIDTVVPADDFPSASKAGGLRFWSLVTGTERPDWADRVITVLDLLDRRSGGRFADLDADARSAVLDGLVDDADFVWFAQLVNAGFYADPGNGGNDNAVSWRMLDWSPAPAGGWPAEEVWVPDRDPIIRRDQVAARYDAVVVGSGAGGGVATWALAQSGRSVLLVERGDYPDTAYLARDHLRNAHTYSGLDHRTLRSSADNPRTVLLGSDPVVLPAWDPRYGSNADTFGGGTRVYGAQAWRFMPEDFGMASRYGIPDGSALADWPISYDDLEPFYTQAEYEIGVCGSAEPHAGATRRSRSYPMTPMPLTAPARRLLVGAEAIGLTTAPVPLAINSTPYDGRPACARCRQCVGFTCPVEAKNGSHNTVLARAAATGNLSVLLGTRAERIITDTTGQVTGVDLVGEVGGSRWRRSVGAEDVVVAAGAVESARLLLASRSYREPDGLGNAHDQVGRHLQGHLYGGAIGIFDDVVNDLVGPGSVDLHPRLPARQRWSGGRRHDRKRVRAHAGRHLRLSPARRPDWTARAGGQAGAAAPATEDAARGWSCAGGDLGRLPGPARPLGDRQPGHPGGPAQRPAAPERLRVAAAAGGARRRLAAGRRRHHRHRLPAQP
jgi:GMC oxidoreductase/Gluconate 2-dehydrogenase subunit 3